MGALRSTAPSNFGDLAQMFFREDLQVLRGGRVE
jgi:hypothetical protein